MPHCDICMNSFEPGETCITPMSFMFFSKPIEQYAYHGCKSCTDAVKASIFETMRNIAPGV